MTFLEPCKKGGYFGSRQFHLRLLKTIPAQPQKQYLPAYLFAVSYTHLTLPTNSRV